MSKGKDLRLRRTGIYARLCREFQKQAEIVAPDYETTKMLVKKFPWVSNHPWSKNGIPENYDGLEFNVMRELREEFALMTKGYDPDTAYSYECAANDFKRLLHEQQTEDFLYVLANGTEEQINRLDDAATLFFEEHFTNEESPYYGTYVPVVAGMTFRLIRPKDQGPKGQ